jgi:hypothetical protein
MKKSEYNSKLRNLARTLSPKDEDRKLVQKIYFAFNNLLGVSNCIQIGSYPRFTAIRPLHDLDILFDLGEWDEDSHNPVLALDTLYGLITEDFENPTDFEIDTSLQTHSVTITLSGDETPIFSVDIVPAYSYGKNEFDQNKYKVPEILKEKDHHRRKSRMWDAKESNSWINSDPRGYIKLATIAGENPDFRKAVKIIKKWKNNLKDIDDNLKLKSFHLEQLLTKSFLSTPNYEIFDAVFDFFYLLPEVINSPNQIEDRAEIGKYIDDYLAGLTQDQKEKIIQARDGLMIKLEKLGDDDNFESILEAELRERKSTSESYLFDKKIPTLRVATITISGWIQKNGIDYRRLDQAGIIFVGNNIRFEVDMGVDADHYKWKVKNSDLCEDPRGEITDHHTHNNPEITQYPGQHYVQCFAIKNNICIASAIQSVWIKNNYHGPK